MSKINVQINHQNNIQAIKKGNPKIFGSIRLANRIIGLSIINIPIIVTAWKNIPNLFFRKCLHSSPKMVNTTVNDSAFILNI